jgi:NAD+ synthetase
MKYGFIRTVAATPKIKVADVEFNKRAIIEQIMEAEKNSASIIVFPELVITGYTCGDLFLQNTLIKAAEKAILDIAYKTKELEILIFVGFPIEYNSKLYNAAAVIKGGKVIGIVPKTNIPNYGEFYELRHFAKGNEDVTFVEFGEDKDKYKVPMGTKLLFKCNNINNLIVGAELCEDVWTPNPPSISHAMAGATVIANCSASDEITGKSSYRQALIEGQSARLVCGYIYANAGDGESTQDLVFGGHNIIAENGIRLSESKRFESGLIYADMDLEKLNSERRRMNTFKVDERSDYLYVDFNMTIEAFKLNRFIDAMPFVPKSSELMISRCEEILSIQAYALKKRLEHIGCENVVIGISGGLDSTLALLVIVRTFDILGIDRKNIHAITMPCFGTTDRTYNNACELTNKLGATLREINIGDAVKLHFNDIGHDINVKDVTYENAQARQRTMLLMNIANQVNGIVIGTGDLSELALGWATYNGDHMSMYGVNASIPKTLVRYLVKYSVSLFEDKDLKLILEDILSTPVSPELLPPKEGEIVQKTEDLVGPYELHDFFLYNVLRFGFAPAKVYYMALIAFEKTYEAVIIKKWITVFYKRFFSQHFKRSCLPDGPKVGSVAVSPRGDLRMPSDACARLWLDEIEKL